MDTLITELIALVKQTAPELWRIAERAVVASIVSIILWLIFLILSLVVCYVLYKKTIRSQQEDEEKSSGYYRSGVDYDLIKTFLIGLAVFLVLVSVVCIDSLAARVINPEYYAIRALISLVK